MARWITQTYSVNEAAEITIGDESVWIGRPGYVASEFRPKDPADAMGMAIVLRQAAKRLEDIGRGMA